MPASNQHIIRKVNAQLNVGSDHQQRMQSERLKEAVQRAVESLAPVLDTVPDDILLRIDKVAVAIDLKEWDPELIEAKIRTALKDELNAIIGSGGKKTETKPEITSAYSEAEQNREVIISFLKTGRLPWWAAVTDLNLAKKELEKLSDPEWVQFMGKVMKQSPKAVKRFVKQWPDASVLDAVSRLAGEKLSSKSIVWLLKGIMAVGDVKPRTEAGQYHRTDELYELVLRKLIYGKDERWIAEELIGTWLKLNEYDPNQQRMMLIKLRKYLEGELLSEYEISRILDQWVGKQPVRDTFDAEEDEIHQKAEEIPESGLDESVSVRNAGVVLLHSYIPLLFKRLGYVEDGSFRSEMVRERAVCALHYLATGESEFPEEEILLSKFLCGWPAGEPLNRFLKFSEYEKEECENLLKSAINHWKALKNTSADGLRTSFLQREGVLKKEAFGFTLYVEGLTHDILLQRLPWSYSVVKLPWMEQILSVQWGTS